MSRKFLKAGNHPWGVVGGKAHFLLLEEFRILEGSQPFDPVQQFRGNSFRLDENSLGKYRLDLFRQFPLYPLFRQPA